MAASFFCAFFAMQFQPAFSSLYQYWEQFEWGGRQFPDWFITGGAGFDWDKGLAHAGKGNAWVRSSVPGSWNAINRFVEFKGPPNATCAVSAWLRVSKDVTDGYMSIRPGSPGQTPGAVYKEVKIVGPTRPDNNGYAQFTFEFPKPRTKDFLFYVGLWGNGRDGWIQVDDVVIQCQWPGP